MIMTPSLKVRANTEEPVTIGDLQVSISTAGGAPPHESDQREVTSGEDQESEEGEEQSTGGTEASARRVVVHVNVKHTVSAGWVPEAELQRRAAGRRRHPAAGGASREPCSTREGGLAGVGQCCQTTTEPVENVRAGLTCRNADDASERVPP